MSLARAWMRSVAGASAAGLAAPLVLAAALGVLALAGDPAHLGSLGELIAGPAAPPSELASPATGAPLAPVPSILAASPPRSAPPGVLVRPLPASAPPRPASQLVLPPAPAAPPTVRPAPVAPGGSPLPGTGVGAPPVGAPGPSLGSTLDGALATGQSVAGSVGGPVGDVGTSAIYLARSIVDRIVPAGARAHPGAPRVGPAASRP